MIFAGTSFLVWKTFCSTPIIQQKEKINAILVLILFIGGAALIVLPAMMNSYLPSDTQIIFDSAASYLENGNLNGSYPNYAGYSSLGFSLYSDYFCRYYNNILMFITIVTIYRFFGRLGFQLGSAEGQILAIIITSIVVYIAILFLIKLVRSESNNIFSPICASILCFSFLAIYYSCTNVYTDSWVIPPMVIGYYYWEKHKKGGSFFSCIMSGVFFAIGALYKVTALIPVVAICICSILDTHLSVTRKLFVIIAIALSVALVFSLFKLWYKNCGIFDFSKEKELYYPWNLWVCFGSHGYGMYSRQDCELIYSTPYEIREQVAWREIIRNYSSYSLSEYLSFLKSKWILTWTDGHFEGSQYTLWPVFANFTLNITQPSSPLYDFLVMFSKGYILFLYFSIPLILLI